MSTLHNYRKRAAECLAYAKIVKKPEQREQMLTMAQTLKRLALETEEKSSKATRH